MRHNMRYALIGVYLLFFSFVTGCSDPADGLLELGRQEEVLPRRVVKEMFRSGLMINMELCETNYDAGLFAIENVISEELSRSYYTKSSVDLCYQLIAVAPCEEKLEQEDEKLFTRYYRIIIRNCGLKTAEIQI